MVTQFVTDAKGKTVAAQIPVDVYAQPMEDPEDLASIAQLGKQKKSPLRLWQIEPRSA